MTAHTAVSPSCRTAPAPVVGGASPAATRPAPEHGSPPPGTAERAGSDGPATFRIVPWVDPVADPHGVHPCSRYVELYWLGILGPSATWLLRRVSYGLEVSAGGFDLDLAETARSLGLGDRMGKNSPFRRSLQRLTTFGLARPHGPGSLAVRTRIPPLPLRHLERLPPSLQQSHRRWTAERSLPEPEQMRRRAARLASGLAAGGASPADIERRLGEWRFHPAVAFRAAHPLPGVATVPGQPSGRPGTTGGAGDPGEVTAGTADGPSGTGQSYSPAFRTTDSANRAEVSSSTRVRTPKPVPPLVR